MNLVDSIHEHAQNTPQRFAVITPQGRLTWAQLDRLIWSTALRLYNQGLREGDRVGVAIKQPLLHLLVSLALTRLGVAQLAVLGCDILRTGPSVMAMLNLKAFLCDSNHECNAIADCILITELESIEITDAEKELICACDANLTWLILQSSGTTGQPKYAELNHRQAWERLKRLLPVFNYNCHDVFWPAPRLDFVVSKLRTYYALQRGAAVCLSGDLPISDRLVGFLDSVGITLSCGTLSHLHQLVVVNRLLPSLRVFEAGSSFISEKIRCEFQEKVSPNLYILYGTNEADGLTIASPQQYEGIPNLVGWPIGDVEIQIVDENGFLLPPECIGEVRARGAGIVEGYLNNPSGELRSFREGWFYPGDCACWSHDGALMLQGRKDDMMIFDGIKIFPAEIESVLVSHPSVIEVAAFPLSHERFQEIPAAAVKVCQPVSETTLVNYCKQALGIKYPRRVLIVEDFPRNQMGKILKRRLREMFRAVLVS